MKIKMFGFIGVVWVSLLLLAGCADDDKGGTSQKPGAGTVSGRVLSAATGEALSGAIVSTGGAAVTTAVDGSYSITTSTGTRYVIAAAMAGYAENYQIVRLFADQTATLDIQLLPVGVTESLLVAEGGTVIVPGSNAEVSIPAGGLVPEAGGTVADSVNIAVTVINPALDADIMPGDFTTEPAGEVAPVPIESFGALLIDARDNNGNRYTLGAGKTAGIRVPVGSLWATPPAILQLWLFDIFNGRWTETGVATLEGIGPNQVYVGSVARFGIWNADKRMITVMVSGCVRDTQDQPVANAMVKTYGVNYSGMAVTYTDEGGNFRVAVRRDALATLGVTFFDRDHKSVTTSSDIGPYSVDTTLSACIVTVPAELQMTARLLPVGYVGTPYSARLAARNGTKPYTWSFSGAMPDGLDLNPTTGQISGAPLAAGTFSGTFQVQDSAASPQTDSTPFTIMVVAPPAFGISTPSLPQGVVGTPYTASLFAANGRAPYTWSVTGNLPTGLILNETTGQLSGTPSAADTFTFTIQAQDSSATVKTATTTFTVVIDAQPAPPPAPTGVAAVAGDAQATITWNPVSGATRYNLYMATDAGVTKDNYSSLAGGMQHPGVTSPFTHTDLTNGTTYYFVVTAVNDIGESVQSSEVSVVPVSSTVSDGLVAYYPFNGNASDESGNGNHGTVFGATLTSDRFGVENSAYNFDGLDDFIKASATNLPTTNRTISLWFYANTVSNHPVVLANGGNGLCGTASFMGMNARPNIYLNKFYMSSHCDIGNLYHSYSQDPIGSWIHWVVTIDGTRQTFYIDGIEVSSNTGFSNTHYVTGKDFAIGVATSLFGIAPYTDSNVGYFNGKIDDIRIYNRALSKIEVQSL